MACRRYFSLSFDELVLAAMRIGQLQPVHMQHTHNMIASVVQSYTYMYNCTCTTVPAHKQAAAVHVPAAALEQRILCLMCMCVLPVAAGVT